MNFWQFIKNAKGKEIFSGGLCCGGSVINEAYPFYFLIFLLYFFYVFLFWSVVHDLEVGRGGYVAVAVAVGVSDR